MAMFLNVVRCVCVCGCVGVWVGGGGRAELLYMSIYIACPGRMRDHLGFYWGLFYMLIVYDGCAEGIL